MHSANKLSLVVGDIPYYSRIYWLYISSMFHPHMPIGKVWIYRLLFFYFVFFVCFFVCTVKDFSAEDKASGPQILHGGS